MHRLSYSPGQIGAAFSAGVTLGICTFYAITGLVAVAITGTEYLDSIVSDDFPFIPGYPMDLLVNIFVAWCMLLVVVGCCLPQAYAAWDLVLTFHLLKEPTSKETRFISRTLTQRHLSLQTKTLLAEALISVFVSIYVLFFSPGVSVKLIKVAWFAQCFVLISRLTGILFVLKYFREQVETQNNHEDADRLEQVLSEHPMDRPIKD